MLTHPAMLGASLTSWMRGGDGPEDEAVASIVGEMIIMWRKVLESKFRK